MSNQDKYTELSCNCTANERAFLDRIIKKDVSRIALIWGTGATEFLYDFSEVKIDELDSE